jgi:TonB family protein
MMSAIANSLPKPERFDLYVRKIRAICGMHSVQVGSRADLPGFMQKLLEDRHLAMDFWALVGKLSNRDGGELSDDQMLAVIVEGVAGGELSGYDRETKRNVDDLRAMLAGVDIRSPGESQVEISPFPRGETGPPGDAEWKNRVIQLPLRPPDSRAALTPEEADGGSAYRPTYSTALPAAPPVELDEELLRLELARLVQLYFDHIDKKKSKLESHLEGLTSVGTVASPTIRRSLEDPNTGKTEELNSWPGGKSRLVLEPDTFLPERNEHSTPVSLEDDPPPPGYRKAILALVFVVVFFEAAFFVYQNRLPLQREINALVQDVREKTGMATPPNLTPLPRAPIGEDASAAQPEQSNQSSEQSTRQGVSTPPPAKTGATNTPGLAASPASRVAGDRVNSSSPRKATTDHAAVQAEQESSDVISLTDLAGAVLVPPAVMEDNLVVSRVPAYPEAAKIDGIEGSVVIQAIISTDGTVKRAHVISGDSHLRNAALEAVYRWRYRPYLLNGRPVDVTTNITVDFDLDR